MNPAKVFGDISGLIGLNGSDEVPLGHGVVTRRGVAWFKKVLQGFLLL